MSDKQKSWYLIMHPRFAEEKARLNAKHQGQVARKMTDLLQDPRPGGSKTPLKGYNDLYRARAGDYRIIYTYNDTVVELLTLRLRNDKTYDDLDQVEKEVLGGFVAHLPRRQKDEPFDWESKVKEWMAARPKPSKSLPDRITERMLTDLQVPEEYWPTLLGIKTEDQLQDCDVVPSEFTYAILDRLFPKREVPVEPPVPIVEKSDIIQPVVEELTGPISVSQEPKEADMKAEPPRKSGVPALIKSKALVLRSSRKNHPMRSYEGNVSKGIGKEAKYSVKLDGKVRLVFEVGPKEHALLTTDQHPELVEMVNEAKKFGGSSEGGGFIINEFRHVIVPTPKGHVFAGVYTRDLEFEFEGLRVSPVAPPSIKPGDVWPGPHVGAKYTLAAGAKDIRYERATSRGTVKTECLSDAHDSEEIAELIAMCRRVKKDGGAIYVNEAREVFAPVDSGKGYVHVYIGHLGKHPWFPEPK